MRHCPYPLIRNAGAWQLPSAINNCSWEAMDLILKDSLGAQAELRTHTLRHRAHSAATLEAAGRTPSPAPVPQLRWRLLS